MFKIAPYLNRGVRGERGKGYVNFYSAFPKRCVREEKHSLHSASSVASAPSVIQTTRESTLYNPLGSKLRYATTFHNGITS